MKELIQQMSTFELGLNVTVTGIILVFAMLILLVAILAIFGSITQSIKKTADSHKEKVRNETLLALSDESFSVTDSNNTISSPISNDDLSDEIVAVISAAIASMYSGSNKRPVIKSIKQTATRRSAWANAGIIDNTRVF